MRPNHSKAKHHHKKAGECLEAGDSQMAMHHTGHVLSALRHASRAQALVQPVADEPVPEEAAPAKKANPFGGMRGRLSSLKKK